MQIEALLTGLDALGASDLFVCEGIKPAVRVDGVVRPTKAPSTSKEELDDFLAKLLKPRAQDAYMQKGDLDVSFQAVNGRRYRVNLYRQRGARALVARAIPAGALALEDLGLPAGVGALALAPRGLVLVTGATGSGKSTTLAAMVHHINQQRSVHIVTIEDPIEYLHADIRARISQREVGSDTESYAEALRRVVRESPDIIVLGELRDFESVRVALAASITGHLVMATLHTIDSAQTLQRLLAMTPEGEREQAALDLSLCLQGIICQRLLPKQGSAGRLIATEVLMMGPAAARLVREQNLDELRDYMKISGGDTHTFNQDLVRLHALGSIDFDVGLAAATSPDEFAMDASGVRTRAVPAQSPKHAALGIDLLGLLQATIDRAASDLHVTVGRPPILRVHGELVPHELAPLSAHDVRTLLYSVLTGRQRTTYELEREVDFAITLPSGHRFRINAYYQRGQMAAAMRLIPSGVPEAVYLCIPPQVLALAQRTQGLVLVVGPTGSGKTTTLACLVDQINQARKCRILTVEDPVEFVHTQKQATIDQREVYADTKSFAAALKYVLRQDPDVILVGEMRDAETMAAAITAAETGHLVLATLHTNDAPSAPDRIIDVFPAHQQPQVRVQLAASLLAIVSQRLLPRRDGTGRVLASEIMVATAAIRTLIRESKMHQAMALIETSRADGMITLDQALLDLFKRGVITYDDAFTHSRYPKSLGPRPEASA